MGVVIRSLLPDPVQPRRVLQSGAVKIVVTKRNAASKIIRVVRVTAEAFVGDPVHFIALDDPVESLGDDPVLHVMQVVVGHIDILNPVRVVVGRIALDPDAPGIQNRVIDHPDVTAPNMEPAFRRVLHDEAFDMQIAAGQHEALHAHRARGLGPEHDALAGSARSTQGDAFRIRTRLDDDHVARAGRVRRFPYRLPGRGLRPRVAVRGGTVITVYIIGRRIGMRRGES